MTPEQAEALRKPFPEASVGKLPRVTCKDCRENKGQCNNHKREKCRDCKNYITTAHIHLDYVGHAEITDRLLQVDSEWAWEPVAFGSDGLPMVDRHGGLWMRLSVAGVTRLGYGHADGKTGPDAVKEAIGDALRNAAMRFGVGLDLWGAVYKGDEAQDVHREEAQWDAVDQAAERDGWESEIAKVRTPLELTELGGRLRIARDTGRLSPATLDHLYQAFAARKAELAQEATSEPTGDPAGPGVAAADPSPSQGGSGQPEAAAGRRSSR